MESTTARALTTTVGRRSFLKMAALGSVFGATSGFASEKVTRAATEEEIKDPFPGSKKVKTICTSCSVGCGVIAEVHNGVWVRQEVAQDHPISLGGHCCKGADMIDMVRSEVRLKYPMVKENGQWKCEDKFTPYIGYGSTPKSAFADWAIEIEMDTSDLHK